MTAEGERVIGRANRALASALVIVVVLALVAPFAVFAVPQLAGADRSYVVLSGSMEPYMSAGDAVVVEAVPPGAIRAGDVITFQRGGDVPTTHRVVERVTDEQGVAFRTEGDANEDPDAGVVRPAEVVGEVRLVIPYIGHVVLFANTPVGMLTFIVIPVGLLVVSEAWAYADARRASRAAAAGPRPAVRRLEREPATDGEATGEAAATGRVADDAAVPAAPGADDATVGPEPRATRGVGIQRRHAATEPGSAPAYGVKTLDLGLTFLVLVILAAYSGWMLYNEIRVESAMVLAGAVMALLLVVATWVLAARAARAGGREPAANSPTTDRPGGASAPPSHPGPERGQEAGDD